MASPIRLALGGAGLLLFCLAGPVAAQEPPPGPPGPEPPRQGMPQRRGPMRDALLRELFLRIAVLPAEEQAQALEGDPLFQQLPPPAQERFRQRLAEFNAQPPERRAALLEQARRARAERPGQGIFLRVAPLPPDEQLRGLESDEAFAALPPHAQERLRQHLERFNNLPPDEQRRVLDRMKQFSELPPEMRDRLERRARRFAEMSPEEREEARRAFESWQQVPPERRLVLLEHLRQLQAAPSEQRPGLANDEQFLSPLEPQERQLFQRLWRLREVVPPARGTGTL